MRTRQSTKRSRTGSLRSPRSVLVSGPTTSKTPSSAKRVSEDPMTEPDKLQWRSDFGWSPYSPAASANPKSGLVVHYDSADQRLADRKSTRLNSSHVAISYAVFCLKKKKNYITRSGNMNIYQTNLISLQL